MFGPQAGLWVGREGRRIWGVELMSPLPEPQGREGQLRLEAPRANSDLLLALVGSGERAWLGQVLGEGQLSAAGVGWRGPERPGGTGPLRCTSPI